MDTDQKAVQTALLSKPQRDMQDRQADLYRIWCCWLVLLLLAMAVTWVVANAPIR